MKSASKTNKKVTAKNTIRYGSAEYVRFYLARAQQQQQQQHTNSVIIHKTKVNNIGVDTIHTQHTTQTHNTSEMRIMTHY